MNKALQLILCVLAMSAVQAKPGYLHGGLIAAHVPADTPEVAHAKVAHYAAYNAAAAAALAADHGVYAHRYVGPLAAPPVLINGVPADTPDVAHAKAAHFAAYNAAAAAAAAAPEHGAAIVAHHGVYAPRYYGPLAAPPVLINGVPADTPEVAHAKAAHFAAYNAAAVAAGAHHGVYHAGIVHPYAYAAGYPAIVNGVPLDTPEVHAAKVAHFAAHAAAKGLLHH